MKDTRAIDREIWPLAIARVRASWPRRLLAWWRTRRRSWACCLGRYTPAEHHEVHSASYGPWASLIHPSDRGRPAWARDVPIPDQPTDRNYTRPAPTAMPGPGERVSR